MKLLDEHYLKISIFILLCITTLSLYPADKLPDVPGTDKTHHFIAYAALAFPVAFRLPKNWIFLMLFFLFCSGMIELIQPYVNRYGEWLDMLANSLGLVIGTVLGIFTKKLLSN